MKEIECQEEVQPESKTKRKLKQPAAAAAPAATEARAAAGSPKAGSNAAGSSQAGGAETGRPDAGAKPHARTSRGVKIVGSVRRAIGPAAESGRETRPEATVDGGDRRPRGRPSRRRGGRPARRRPRPGGGGGRPFEWPPEIETRKTDLRQPVSGQPGPRRGGSHARYGFAAPRASCGVCITRCGGPCARPKASASTSS